MIFKVEIDPQKKFFENVIILTMYLFCHNLLFMTSQNHDILRLHNDYEKL